MLVHLGSDVKVGFRRITKNLKLSAVVIVSLAIGIGANAAVFSLIDAIVLKNLPVAHPEQLVILHWASSDMPAKEIAVSMNGRVDHDSAGRLIMSTFSYQSLKAFRAQNDVLSGSIAFAPIHGTMKAEDRVEFVEGEVVTGNYFSELGVSPVAGRLIVGSDESSSNSHVVVISFNYWMREFDRSPSAVGKMVTLNKAPYVIVGIATAGFHGLQPGRAPDFWLPLTETPDQEMTGIQFSNGQSLSNSPGLWWLSIVGRTKPGINEQHIASELDRIYTQDLLAAAGVPVKGENLPHLYVTPGARGLETLRQRLATPLRLLAVGMGLVLLAACFNVAMLLLARSTARGKEMSVRLALGASRFRLATQLLMETILLTGIGGVAGIGLGYWFAQIFLLLLSRGQVPLDLEMHLSASAIGFTLALSLVTGVLLGAAVAIQAARQEINPLMKEGGSGRAFRFVTGKLLVVAQLAISLILVVAAGLFLRTLSNLENQNIGFEKRGLLLFGLDPKQAGYTPVQISNLYSNLLQRIQTVPEVTSATLARITLISNNWSAGPVIVAGENAGPDRKPMARRNMVGPNFFRTLGIRVLLGRDIEASDTSTSPKVAAVNEAFARMLWPNRNPVGRQFTFSDYSANKDFYTVVALVADAKYDSLREEVPPTAYVPYTQIPRAIGLMYFEVRTTRDPVALITTMRRIVHEQDPDLPLRDVKTQAEQIDEALMQERLFAKSASLFGVFVLLLAAIGIYGLSMYSVAQRVREIGIRMALGAQRADVLRMVLLETVRFVVLGGIIGLTASFALTRLVATVFFGVLPTDPLTMVIAFVVVCSIAVLSTIPSAQRASKQDPAMTLRYE